MDFSSPQTITIWNQATSVGTVVPGRKKNRADLIELFNTMKGLSSTPWSHFFKKAEDTSTTGHTWKLAKMHCRCNSRLYFFSLRVINRWNNLSQEDVDAQSITVSRIDSRKDVYGRWTSLKSYSLLVLSAARKDNQELVHQDGTSMPPGEATPGKYQYTSALCGHISNSQSWGLESETRDSVFETCDLPLKTWDLTCDSSTKTWDLLETWP